MASKSERTQVYLVPQNETAPSGSSSGSVDATATQETVKIVVPLLNATSGEPMNWCATFAQKPPSPLELWPCDDTNTSRSQRFAFDSNTGDLSPLYTKSWAGSLARVQSATPSSANAANSMDDVDDSMGSAVMDEEESPSKRFYRRMAEKAKKNKKLVSVKAKVGSKKLDKVVKLRRQADDSESQDDEGSNTVNPIQAAADAPEPPKEDPAAPTPAPAPAASTSASSTPSSASAAPAPSAPVASDAQQPQPMEGDSTEASASVSSPSPVAPSPTGAKKGGVSLRFVPAGSGAKSFAVGKAPAPSSSSNDLAQEEEDSAAMSSNDVAANGSDDIGSDGDASSTGTAPIREAVQQSLGEDEDDSTLGGQANSFASNNFDESSNSDSSDSGAMANPNAFNSAIQPADLEAVPTPADM